MQHAIAIDQLADLSRRASAPPRANRGDSVRCGEQGQPGWRYAEKPAAARRQARRQARPGRPVAPLTGANRIQDLPRDAARLRVDGRQRRGDSANFIEGCAEMASGTLIGTAGIAKDADGSGNKP